MFTGLIEAVCTVKSLSLPAGQGTMALTIDLGELADGTQIGDSIAINGACLTVAKLTGSLATFDLSVETLKKSNLGKLKPALQVNVERSLIPADRLGGHFVQGHIDGTAAIRAVNKQGQFANMEFTAAPELLDQIVVKGSVAVDGISLTVAETDRNSFTVALIPQTLEKTTLGKAKIGNEVNIEIDIITKIVKEQLERILPTQHKLTVEKLKELGF